MAKLVEEYGQRNPLSFIKELTFRSLDQKNLSHAFRQIQELRKRLRLGVTVVVYLSHYFVACISVLEREFLIRGCLCVGFSGYLSVLFTLLQSW